MIGVVVMDSHQHVLDLIPAYVLDSLEEEEAIQVRQHLTKCKTCQDEMRAFENVAAQLPFAISRTSPPKTLRTRLLQSLDKPSQMDGLPSSPTSQNSIWEWLNRWRIPAFAGVGLILILAFSNVLLWQQISLLRAEITDTKMIVEPLYPSRENTIATGLLVMDPLGNYGTIIVDSLPIAIEGQEYQVWLSKDERIDSGGVFTVHENGYGAQVIYAPESLIFYTHVWVTVEPEGGSNQPTGMTILQTIP